MRSVRDSRNRERHCQHEQTTTGLVAGMERTVCTSCGHVSVRLLSDAVTRGGIPTPRHAVDSR